MKCPVMLYYDLRALFYDIENYLDKQKSVMDEIYQYQYNLSQELSKDHIDANLILNFTTLLTQATSEMLSVTIFRKIRRLKYRAIFKKEICHCNMDESFGEKIKADGASKEVYSILYSLDNLEREIHKFLEMSSERIGITHIRYGRYIRDTQALTAKRTIVKSINKLTLRYLHHVHHNVQKIMFALYIDHTFIDYNKRRK